MAFKTHQQAIESVLENIEGEPGERMSQLQLLVSARMLAEEVRRLQDGDESEPCVCSTDFTCMASEHAPPTPPPGLWWSPSLGVIEQVDIVGDEAQYERLSAGDSDRLPVHRLPSDAIELVAAPSEADCEAAHDHALAVETAVQAWRDARSNDEIRARHIPMRVWKALDALAELES